MALSDVFGVGTMLLTAALVAACASPVDEPVSSDVEVALADELEPQGKASRGSSASMTCVQATSGCTPVGYRSANCAMSNLKPNTYVITCVKAKCPDVYGYDNGRGESCFTPQKVALDGTAIAFFPLAPDATYSITTYTSKNGVPGDVLATSSTTLSSSVGVDTQCGGTPSGSCL